MNKFITIIYFIRHFFSAKGKHSLHSPFVFEFYNEVIKGSASHLVFNAIEKIRISMKRDQSVITVVDYGAGSKVTNSNQRSIASIAQNSEKSQNLSQLLFRIVNYRKPKVMLDLGTSFGITTLYQAFGNEEGKVFTFEGCGQTAARAESNFKLVNATNIELIIGNIDQTLPNFLSKQTRIDFVFFDANHRYEPTIRYFLLCLEKADENSIFIFDDIYWSREMKRAWEEIKKHPQVTLSIDLFYLGIIFFRKKHPVQHFTLS